MGRTVGELDKWIVPKRCNVYQTLAFLAVLDAYPSCCNFNAANQSKVATKMRVDYGASKSGTMQPQAARTTKALAQYMGFIKVVNDRIVITDIGYKFLNNHRVELINKGHTLAKPIGHLISEADEWKQQMIKIQLTNPSQPKCEDVSIYPFRYVLKLLLQLEYIDMEEMALFVLTSKKERDLTKTITKIRDYRSKRYIYRDKQKKKFATTKFGNIALKKAPSAGYFMSLCEATGLVERCKKKISNPGTKKVKKITALQIKPAKIVEVNRIILLYGARDTLKFSHDERKMWDYYYCQDGIEYPIEIEIKNKTSIDTYIQVENSTKSEMNNQEFELRGKEKEIIYTFPTNSYIAHVYDMTDTVPAANINVSSSSSPVEVTKTLLSTSVVLSKKEIILEIRELYTKKGITTRIQKQLDMFSMLTGKTVSNVKMYRGAYLELYFAMLLKKLKAKKVIDDYQSSVNMGTYNIPHPVPQKPDFVVTVGNTNIVLEVTLMRPTRTRISKEMKLEIEGAMRHMQEQTKNIDAPMGKKSMGIFAAGAINSLVTSELANWAKTYGVVKYKTLDLEKLVELLEKEDRLEIEKYIK